MYSRKLIIRRQGEQLVRSYKVIAFKRNIAGEVSEIKALICYAKNKRQAAREVMPNMPKGYEFHRAHRYNF